MAKETYQTYVQYHLVRCNSLTYAPKQLRSAGATCAAKTGGPPNLIVVVLPDGGDDIYTAVKQYVPYCNSLQNVTSNAALQLR